MGASPYKTRRQLVREYATGIRAEVDAATRARFNDGHRVEALSRPIAEALIGDELYPVTGVPDDPHSKLSASFDGLTLDACTAWECKLWNETKAEDVRKGHVPDCDWWQVVQQADVSGADRVIYMVSDGTPERTVHVVIAGDSARSCAGSLRQAWEQFAKDVAQYVAQEPAAPKPVGSAPETLPALRVEARGMVTSSNLTEFREHAEAVLAVINRELTTDEDFVNAELAVKFCKQVEDRLETAKANVLAQMESVDEVCRTIDSVSAETRKVRLELDRLVKSEKERRRAEIVLHYADQVRAHYAEINQTLGEFAMAVPHAAIAAIGEAIKGRKTLGSITDAADAACATAKIEASQQAEMVRQNIAVLDTFSEHASLFADRVVLCAGKAPDDLRNLAKSRIAEHQQREAARLVAERDRIRAEEQAKLERGRSEQDSAAAAERARLAAEKKAQDKREREHAIANATLHAAACDAVELLRGAGFGEHLVTLKLAAALNRETKMEAA
jgi:predicted phage-related endonuclease